MLLVTAAPNMIQMPLEDAIGSDDSPINDVATLAVFLARLRPHQSELSPNKTRSEPRESKSWATSSLKMVSVHTMTKSPSCLACLCLRTSNSSAAYLMVLVTTSSPILTGPAHTPDYDPAHASIGNVVVCALLAELAAPSILRPTSLDRSAGL